MEKLRELLDQSIDSLGTDHAEVIGISSEDTVQKACEVLEKNNISAVVVFDEKNKTSLGMIDMLDVVAHLVATFPDEEVETNVKQSLNVSGFVFSQEPVRFILNKSFVGTFIPLPKTCKIVHALDPLANGGLHRMPIVDLADDVESLWLSLKNYPVVRVVSQFAVVKYIYSHKDELKGTFLYEKLSTFKSDILNNSPLIVDTKISTINALRLLDNTKRNAMVVVDDNNHPIINFSANDIKKIKSNELQDLLLPLPAYLEKEGRKDPNKKVISCTLDFTLIDAIEIIVKNHIHRLWVVAADGKTVVAVLSLTSILKEVLRNI